MRLNKKLFSSLLIIFLLASQIDISVRISYAQQSPALSLPVTLQGVGLFANNPFQFDFLVDAGDLFSQQDQLNAQTNVLTDYFFTALTVPDQDKWVNLSPHESNRLTSEALAHTQMGYDLLDQDLELKKLTAELLSPEHEVGKKYWAKIKDISGKNYQDLKKQEFHRVWIVPKNADVYVDGSHVFIIDSQLDVLLEKDYTGDESNQISSQEEEVTSAMRNIVLPQIVNIVNTDIRFTKLRQIYRAVILAAWYKQNLKNSLFTFTYADKNSINGLSVENLTSDVYKKYIEIFKQYSQGNVQEEYDAASKKIIPIKYFTGGAILNTKPATLSTPDAKRSAQLIADRPTFGTHRVGVFQKSDQAALGTISYHYDTVASESRTALELMAEHEFCRALFMQIPKPLTRDLAVNAALAEEYFDYLNANKASDYITKRDGKIPEVLKWFLEFVILISSRTDFDPKARMIMWKLGHDYFNFIRQNEAEMQFYISKVYLKIHDW